jgi:hypothetical protein
MVLRNKNKKRGKVSGLDGLQGLEDKLWCRERGKKRLEKV